MKLSLLATSVLLAAVSAGAYAYTPGTYTAAIAGQNGPVKVEVTTSADKILSVKIIDQKKRKASALRLLPHFLLKLLKHSPLTFKALQEHPFLLPLLRRPFKNA